MGPMLADVESSEGHGGLQKGTRQGDADAEPEDVQSGWQIQARAQQVSH